MIPLLLLLFIAVAILIIVYVGIMASTRRIVPPNFVDVVVRASGAKLYSSNPEHSPTNETTYHEYPEWVPIIGTAVTRVPLGIQDIAIGDLTLYDKDRAMFDCNLHAYLIVDKPLIAATRISSILDMKRQLIDILSANARGSSTSQTLQEIMVDRSKLVSSLRTQVESALPNWGATLTNMELLSFTDTPGSENVSNLARQRSKEIETSTRQQVAENEKRAIFAEAKAQEQAEMRVITMEREINVADQQKESAIFKMKKDATEQEMLVEKAAIVKHEENIRDQQKVRGEGEKLYAAGYAEAEASRIRIPGKAEAEVRETKLKAEASGKKELKNVMNEFKQLGITAMVAEQLVDMEKSVNMETAKALQNADIRMLSGGDGDGFSLAKLLQSLRVGDNEGAKSLLNRIGRPNDLGFSSWDEFLNSIGDEKRVSKKKKFTPKKEVE